MLATQTTRLIYGKTNTRLFSSTLLINAAKKTKNIPPTPTSTRNTLATSPKALPSVKPIPKGKGKITTKQTTTAVQPNLPKAVAPSTTTAKFKRAVSQHMDKHVLFWARVLKINQTKIPTKVPPPRKKPAPTPPPERAIPFDEENRTLAKTMLASAKRMAWMGSALYLLGLSWVWYMSEKETIWDFTFFEKPDGLKKLPAVVERAADSPAAVVPEGK